MADFELTMKALLKLREVLPSQLELTTSALKTYARGLEDLDDETIIVACARAVREEEWFPTAAKLRKLGGTPTVEARASMAWDEVLRKIGDVGAYRTPVFADPAAAAVINRMGGWIGLCQQGSEWLREWGRRTFLAEYVSVAEYGGGNRELRSIHGSEEMAIDGCSGPLRRICT